MSEIIRYPTEVAQSVHPRVEQVLAGGSSHQAISFGEDLKACLLGILALDTQGGRMYETGNEAWGIVHFSPRACR